MWFIAISQYGIPSTWKNNHCVLDSPCHFRTTNPYRFPLSEDGDLVRWQRWERQGFSRDDSGLELSGISMNFWFSRDLGKDFRMRCRCSKLPWALGFSMAFPMVCMRLSFCRSSRTCWKASTKVINSSKLNDWLLTQDSLTFFDYEPLISILSDLPPTAPLLRWCEQNSIGHPDSIKATLGCRLHVSFWNTEGIYMDLRF